MKITYIKLFNKKDEKMLMKHLRNSENQKWYKLDSEKGKARGKFSNIKNMLDKNPLKELSKKVGKNINAHTIIKKNQVVLVATALMLVTAGYLNYTNNIKMATLGDAQLVSANIVGEESSDDLKKEEQSDTASMFDLENEEQIEDVIETSTYNEENHLNTVEKKITDKEESNDSEYFTKTKLERETMYSQMIETYQKILGNNNIPNDQKAIATNEIKNINSQKNAIATIENLIKIKGFKDVAILVNGNSINIVVKTQNNLEPNQVAQIQNIISRELHSNIEDIHITTHP